MSNYIKNSSPLPQAKTAARVINSNPKMDRMMKVWMAEQQRKAAASGEFSEGIGAPVVEMPQVLPEKIIEEAQLEAEDILMNANYKAEQIALQAQSQAQEAYEEKKAQGYADGKQEADAYLAQMQEQMQAKYEADLNAVIEDYEERKANLETDIVEALSVVIEKTFGIFMEDKREVMVFLIRKTLAGIESGKNFKIRATSENAKYIANEVPRLKEELGADVTIDVQSDSNLADNDCVIETEYGVYHCGIDLQLRNLLMQMKALSL